MHVAKAAGLAKPHVDRLAVQEPSADTIEAATEGHAIARGDSQIPDLIADRPVVDREPFPYACIDSRGAQPTQRLDGIEGHHVGRVIGETPSDVLVTNRARPVFDHGPDLRLAVALRTRGVATKIHADLADAARRDTEVFQIGRA